MSATATVDIGDLIESRPGVSGGQPCLRGTGVTVARVAHLAHAEGLVAAEIVKRLGGGLQLAAIHAALAYYYSNRDRSEERRVGKECA